MMKFSLANIYLQLQNTIFLKILLDFMYTELRILPDQSIFQSQRTNLSKATDTAKHGPCSNYILQRWDVFQSFVHSFYKLKISFFVIIYFRKILIQWEYFLGVVFSVTFEL